MGEPPAWYLDIKAAQYLGIKPWEINEVSVEWRNRALIAMSAEAEGRKDSRQRKS